MTGKYYCEECKEYVEPIFTETWSHSDYIGHGGWYPEQECTCPICGGQEVFEAVEKCEACGETVYETEDIGGIEFCPECKEKLKNILSETVDRIVGELDIDALDAKGVISDFYREEY